MTHTPFHHLFIALRALIKGLVLISLWLLVFLSGFFFFREFSSPINIVLGLPLLLLGVTMGLLSLYELIAGVISWQYGKTHCPFCDNTDLNDSKKPLTK